MFPKKQRSIYIVSRMKPEKINEKFSFLDKRFKRTFECDNADFVVFDLSHPIDELQQVLVLHMQPRFLACKPVILTALERLENECSLDITTDITKLFGCEPPICKNDRELVSALEWFSFMFPTGFERFTDRYFERIIDYALHR